MSISLYDTFAQEKRPFTPKEAGKISLYVCGITVYDYCHMGHARVFVAFDVITRFLRSEGFEVNYVRNITDVDDKILKRALEQGTSMEALTNQYITAMHEDMGKLGILPATREPRATAHIDTIITLTEKLIAKGAAYPADNGDVYFRVGHYDSYGSLSHQDIDALQAGNRVEVGEEKENPLDFALWKAAKPDEISWGSPWGKGRPGWHIECSAMSMHELGEEIDIHGGGQDLCFPHHENERAQSEAATGKTFVNYWMHVGFLNINNEKMSKSLGNFFTIQDVLAENDPEAVRYFLLASHYRSQLNYQPDSLEGAKSALCRLYGALRGMPLAVEPDTDNPHYQAFLSAMRDDFNTPQALAALFELATGVHQLKDTDANQADVLASTLKAAANLLGILERTPEAFFQGAAQGGPTDEEIEALISERQAARANKDWALSDKIRDDLQAQGILLEDTQGKTLWRRQ